MSAFRRFSIGAVLAAALAACMPAAAQEARFPTEQITPEQWKAYFDDVSSLPGVKVNPRRDLNTTIITAPKAPTYYFTMEKHPAHPASLRMEIVTLPSGPSFRIEGYYAGDKDGYARWRGMVEENIRRMMRPASQPAPRGPLGGPEMKSSEYFRTKAAYALANKPSGTEDPGAVGVDVELLWVKAPPEGSVVVVEINSPQKGAPPVVIERPYAAAEPSMRFKTAFPCGLEKVDFKLVARIYTDAARDKPLSVHEQPVPFTLNKAFLKAMRIKECD